MADKQKAMRAAVDAIASIGLGYDLTTDLYLKYCKKQSPDSCLLKLDEKVREIVLPGGVVVPDVSTSIKCDKGERTRFSSDVLSFQQMSELFNQEMGLSGKVPSGLFNNCFQFKGCWQEDASNTKSLAFDGWFITLYNVALAKSQIILHPHVKQAVPSSWDPAALASFIEKYGTHIVVGVKMGGIDVVYVKQTQSSTLQAADVQKTLKETADKRFLDTNGHFSFPSGGYGKQKLDVRIQRLRFTDVDDSNKDVGIIYKRRGGNDYKEQSHNQWQSAIQFDPDVISMSFVPITSLLSGVPGSGFLNHAINLYLRYKPQIEELHQFLEFQLPRHWAPVFSDLPLGRQRKQRSSSSLQFSFMGPKLYINTDPVIVGARPITGMRLYLEGKKCDQLAIHLQHLSSMPQIFQIHGDPRSNFSCPHYDHSYYEAVQWKRYSHVCTAPVQSDDDLSIVTGAQFQIESHGLKKVLFLRLLFSKVSGVKLVKNQTWEGTPDLAQKSGIMSTIFSGQFSTFQKPIAPRPTQIDINSAVYPGGPPVPVQSPKMLKFVDTTELIRGPQHTPGYWVVSGAKLEVVRNKISLRVKYSLLTATYGDDDDDDIEEEEDIGEVPSRQ